MKIPKLTSALILFGPTAVFLAALSYFVDGSWGMLAVGIGAGLLNTVQVIVLALAETWWPANPAMKKKQRILDKLQENGPKVIGLVYLAGGLAWGSGHLLRAVAGLEALPSTWLPLQVIAGIIVIDFGDYWAHRMQHHVNWLWERHAVHHSVLEFSLFGAAKIHWLDTPFVVLSGLFVLGLGGMAMAPAAATLVAWFALSTMLHVNADLSLGPLDRIFQVPAVHHMHHELETPVALAFGGVLCVFDRMFGTAQPTRGFALPIGLGPRHPRPSGATVNEGSPT